MYCRLIFNTHYLKMSGNIHITWLYRLSVKHTHIYIIYIWFVRHLNFFLYFFIKFCHKWSHFMITWTCRRCNWLMKTFWISAKSGHWTATTKMIIIIILTTNKVTAHEAELQFFWVFVFTIPYRVMLFIKMFPEIRQRHC